MSRIESFFLQGPAGRIECMLKSPDGGAEPRAAAVVCHPHPLFGGTMHNKVVHAVSEGIVGAGIPVLRFNFRGTGASAGAHDSGRGEQDDLLTVMDHLSKLYPGRPLLLAGYSFGAHVALAVGCRDERARALVGVGLPVNLANFEFLRACHRTLTIIQGEQDPFGSPALVMAAAARTPDGARVVVIKGAAHNFAGHLEELERRVAEAVPEEMRAPDRPTPPVGEDPRGVVS